MKKVFKRSTLVVDSLATHVEGQISLREIIFSTVMLGYR